MVKSMFVFPGQGSQVVGMGRDLYDNFDVAKQVFMEVDDALNQKLSDLIFNGPIETLTLTSNVQPAIMSVSIATMRVILELSGKKLSELSPYVAGHSLGEYSALCAAGSLSLHDTAKLLRLRGDAMQRAVPEGLGAMAVIMGLTIEQVSDVCKTASALGCCDVANDNGPGQVVISGSKPAIERAMELAKETGAKRAMLLPLSVPPHSGLMVPAQNEMRDAFESVDLKAPVVPLISNRTTVPVSDPIEIKDLLVQQITNGVRWRETVLSLPALGIEQTIEVGPGKVLTGLTPRIAEGITAIAINNVDDVRAFVESLK